ncbi:anti-anti-sigma factor [Kitasatospora gansuensis]|uniref:Anti-anti-sigma factor n=1 Tax=Kitasatospora gansuensis TaxID=258050 RepID=A0A7W7WKK3_9ACTN|nr:STAS domain-containing protein [Kitasatospora gansuensis]MBB4950506.1 anti-anti-sigma factor [Kitasatospora gansuensis]
MPVLQSLNVYRHDRGIRASVMLAGELDLATVPLVRAALESCAREGIHTIDVDVSALTFCDVSGLNVFLAAARAAAAAGGSLRLHHPRRALARLLDLSGAGFLLRDLPGLPGPPVAAPPPPPYRAPFFRLWRGAGEPGHLAAAEAARWN